MRDTAEEIREIVRKRCEIIEEEHKRFLSDERKLQEDIAKKSAQISSMAEKKFSQRSEAGLKKLTRKQVGFSGLAIFALVTCTLLLALNQVGYDIKSGSVIKIFLISLLIAICIELTFFFILNSMRKRVIELSNGLEAIAKGNNDFRLDVTNAGVLAKTYMDYNEMAEKLKLYRSSMEEAVMEAERANQAKSDFLSNMSHEIRTPMNAIVGMTDILLRTDMDLKQREYLMNIKNSGAALLTIINDILDISKIEAGKMEIVMDNYEPMSMFNDLSMIFLNRIGDKPIELVYDIDPDFPSGLYADSLRIRQILINLTNNAIKFTNEGRVTLRTRICDRDEEFVSICYEIMDTGQGIKEEDIDKLFGAFNQVDSKKNHHKEGSGLGLSISKQLVELMGGSIGVTSEYGKGSVFHFTIRQKVTNWEPLPIDAGEKIISFGSLNYGSLSNGIDISFIAPSAKILVVDDNEINLKVAKGLLEPLEMTVDLALSGEEAIARVKSMDYDIVFMDHMMPQMDGIEATEKIRSLEDTYFKTLPIVALTANAIKSDRDKFFQAGMNDFVSKPIDFKEICACIKQWLPGKKVKVVNITTKNEDYDTPMPKELDYEAGIKLVGSKKQYINLLGDFYKLIDIKADKIDQLLKSGQIKEYTVEVHALKNTARMIGDNVLSLSCSQLEEFGRRGAIEELRILTPEVMRHYKELKEILLPYAETEADKAEVSVDRIKETLNRLKRSVEEFDLENSDKAMLELKGFVFPYDASEDIAKLDSYVADVAMDDILSLTDEILNKLWP